MKRSRKRLLKILFSLTSMGIGGFIFFSFFGNYMIFYYTPQEIAAIASSDTKILRVGGVVQKGSWDTSQIPVHTFVLEEGSWEVPICYKGALPSLFKEGQRVVVQGYKEPSGVFKAQEVFAKHDETYGPRPKECLKEP